MNLLCSYCLKPLALDVPEDFIVHGVVLCAECEEAHDLARRIDEFKNDLFNHYGAAIVGMAATLQGGRGLSVGFALEGLPQPWLDEFVKGVRGMVNSVGGVFGRSVVIDDVPAIHTPGGGLILSPGDN